MATCRLALRRLLRERIHRAFLSSASTFSASGHHLSSCPLPRHHLSAPCHHLSSCLPRRHHLFAPCHHLSSCPLPRHHFFSCPLYVNCLFCPLSQLFLVRFFYFLLVLCNLLAPALFPDSGRVLLCLTSFFSLPAWSLRSLDGHSVCDLNIEQCASGSGVPAARWIIQPVLSVGHWSDCPPRGWPCGHVPALITPYTYRGRPTLSYGLGVFLTDGGVRCRVVEREAYPILWLWGVTYRGRRQKPCRHLHDPQTRHSALGRPGLSGHDLFFLWTFCTEMCLMAATAGLLSPSLVSGAPRGKIESILNKMRSVVIAQCRGGCRQQSSVLSSYTTPTAVGTSIRIQQRFCCSTHVKAHPENRSTAVNTRSSRKPVYCSKHSLIQKIGLLQ